jgi:hypothetical protein
MAYLFNESAAPKPVIDTGPRSGKGKMKDSELQRIMHGLITDAEALTDGELSPRREEATDYFLGKPFGNEEEGRSQVVITEVRDVVHGTLPSMLRVFFGPERCVEFAPRTEQGAPAARQATDYVQYIFAEDNAGFLRSREVALDGLVRKLGIFKWGWQPPTKQAICDYGVTREALEQLAMREDVTLTEVTTADSYGADGDSDLYDVEYTVKRPGRVCVWALPPEEFIYDREATSIDDAVMVAHRTEMTRGELIAIGISEDDIDEYGEEDDSRLDWNVERQARHDLTSQQRNPDTGPANHKIKYVEAYVKIDVDGDGVAELRKVCTIGPSCYPVHNRPAEERPFSMFCPFPEPHTITGQSQADLVMDLQKIKSSVTRGMLDSFALSIFPRMAVIEGAVSIEDVLNTEIGAPIRTKRDNAVTPFSHPFTGEKAMPILQYFDDVSENRTGQDKGSMGLDADALQSSTKQAVNAAVTKSQEQIEMMCRIFAEQALKPLFRGIYRLIVKHQPEPRLVKLRGQYIPVNPASWEADLDVIVNVALGTSLPEQRLGALAQTAESQKEILQLIGPDNPLVSVGQLRETFARMLELSGFRDVSAFFKPVDPNWTPPPPAGPPPPTPEQVIAQAQLQMERMKTERELAMKEAELRQKEMAAQRDYELEVRKMANDFTLRRYQIDAQFRAQFTEGELERDAAQQADAISLALDIRKQMHAEEDAQHARDLAAQDQEHRQGMERDAQAHDQQMAEQQAAAQSQAGSESAE